MKILLILLISFSIHAKCKTKRIYKDDQYLHCKVTTDKEIKIIEVERKSCRKKIYCGKPNESTGHLNKGISKGIFDSLTVPEDPVPTKTATPIPEKISSPEHENLKMELFEEKKDEIEEEASTSTKANP